MTANLKQRNKTASMALCGLFAAVTAVCSWISIPLGFTPVPVNLATLAVFLAGALLGPKYGPLSMAVYTLAGAAGIPVFAGFRGGFSVLAGPTGGYVLGYIAAAFVTGFLLDAFLRGGRAATGRKAPAAVYSFAVYAFAMICALAACYALGTSWFMLSTHTGFAASMVMCVIPFLPGDALKITAATLLARRLKKFV